MPYSSDLAWMHRAPLREARVDALRGVALWCIYVDHIPRNVLNIVTLRNFGFSDAAEVFVVLAGFACVMAYVRSFAREGAAAGLRKIVMRCARIYLFQVAMLVATVAIVSAWNGHFHLEPGASAPLVDGNVKVILHGLTLRAQPSNLNILPLYIVLLSVFPIIYLGIRYSLWLTLLLSGILWLASNIYPNLNLINSFDGQGWYFDPFSWQFIFVIGAATAVLTARNAGQLPRWPWLMAVCWVFLAFSLLEVFPWSDYGLPDLAFFPLETPDKTHLAPLRLLHAVALIYAILSVRDRATSHRSLLFRAAEVCGRHSLELFSLGTMLALVGRLASDTFDDGWPMQVVVNVVGLGGMVVLGVVLERARQRASARAQATGVSNTAMPRVT